MQKVNDWTVAALPQNGFALVPSYVDAPTLNSVEEALSRLHPDSSAGMRHLLKRSLSLRRFARSPAMVQLASDSLGALAKPIKAILFDKTAATNWYVTWHQDLTIAVKQRIDVNGFNTWSIKDGIDHVQPPAAVLGKIVALRVHLDDCPLDNGPIKFMPGSHKRGILEPDQIAALRELETPVVLPCQRGDIILMSPLIVHSSSQATCPDSRRVLHIEYATDSLPGGLKYAEGGGLDSVELILAIEEEFGLAIPDKHAEQLYTVGLTYDYLKLRLRESNLESCLTQKIFYMLRRAMVANFNLSRKAITLDTRLDQIIELSELEQGWDYMALHCDLKVPPFTEVSTLFGLPIAERTVTMRQLVRLCLTLNAETIFADIKWDDQIWQRLVKVIVQQINCHEHEVTPQAYYGKDLGVC